MTVTSNRTNLKYFGTSLQPSTQCLKGGIKKQIFSKKKEKQRIHGAFLHPYEQIWRPFSPEEGLKKIWQDFSPPLQAPDQFLDCG